MFPKVNFFQCMHIMWNIEKEGDKFFWLKVALRKKYFISKKYERRGIYEFCT